MSTGQGGVAAVVGLGSMGLGVATSLLRAGVDARGYDVGEAGREAFRKAGGRAAATVAEAVAGADTVVCLVVNARQTADVLFGEAGAAAAMPAGAVFISSATMDPADARDLGRRLEATGRHFLDAPVSGGAARAAAGELTVLASGSRAAFAAAERVLSAIAARVYDLGDEVGTGAAFKMINQHLAGIHIAAACEAITLAARQGLDLAKVYEVIVAAAGNSWMFENRIPHVLSGDYRPKSAVGIFVKDLGIVQDMTRAARHPAPLAAAALQMFLAADAMGMGRDDDASVARVYAALAGIDLPGDGRADPAT